jgi:NADH dehydrogenase/endonuclease-8
VVELIRTSDEARVVGHLGPDPLREDWDADEAVRRLARDPARPVAAALLDQTRLAGLGNLWVNEICFLRGISPWTAAGDVDLARTVALGARCLRQSITVRGNGQVTTGNPRPGEEHWVYGRTGLACRRCGTRIRHAPEVPGDAARRATWWCPSCQPGPGPDTDTGRLA